MARKNISSLSLSVILLFFLRAPFAPAGAQTEKPPYLDVAGKIARIGLEEGYACTFLQKLTRIGGRLTASPQTAAAVDMAILSLVLADNL